MRNQWLRGCRAEIGVQVWAEERRREMTTIPHEPAKQVADTRRWRQLLVPEMWASLAIAVMWLSVLFTSIYGADIVNSTVGGTSSTVPSAVIVAFFAFFGTWVVAKYGFRHGSAD